MYSTDLFFSSIWNNARAYAVHEHTHGVYLWGRWMYVVFKDDRDQVYRVDDFLSPSDNFIKPSNGLAKSLLRFSLIQIGL